MQLRMGGAPAQVVSQGRGTVKHFNPDNGFGFIQLEDGGDDAFVHISAVEAAGLSTLAEGQELEFQLVERGGKISASDLTIVGELIVAQQRGPAPVQRQLTGERTTGTVKFFNSAKGFGFISRDDGQPDAFVHVSAVERSGLDCWSIHARRAVLLFSLIQMRCYRAFKVENSVVGDGGTQTLHYR